MVDPVDVPLNVNQFDLWACPDGYIFIPNGAIWSASFVDKRLGVIGGLRPSTWIAQNRAIEGMTWVPGEDQLLHGRLIVKAGWIDHPGARLFNLYQPPNIEGGDAAEAGRWVDLVKRVYPDTWWHITQWFAHRVQHPGVKINHALVFGGSTRVGKDTILKPLLYAVGYPNTASVAPTMLLERFNEFYETVVLVVSEARDLGDINRYQLYDHLKQYIAAPPETIMIDTKNVTSSGSPSPIWSGSSSPPTTRTASTFRPTTPGSTVRGRLWKKTTSPTPFGQATTNGTRRAAWPTSPPTSASLTCRCSTRRNRRPTPRRSATWWTPVARRRPERCPD
jgi:hypothetical protein